MTDSNWVGDVITHSDVHNAAICGECYDFMTYISDEPQLLQCNCNSTTLLADAAFGGDINIVEHLLSIGADINKPSVDGKLPIYSALKEGHLKIAKVLVEHGAKLELLDKHIYKLSKAAAYGQKEVVESYLSYKLVKIDVNQTIDPDCKATPICLAALFGHLDVVKLLVDAGADTHQSLNYAIEGENLEIAEYLTQIGCDRSALSQSNLSDIFVSLSESLKIIQSILNSNDYTGKSIEISNLSVVKYLTGRSVDIQKHASLSKTVLNNELHAVEYLISQKCNVNEIDSNGNTPLTNAVRSGNISIVEKIIHSGGDVCRGTLNGRTPLSFAVELEHVSLVELLLNNGAVSTAQTALLDAVEVGNLKIIQCLEKRGVSFNFTYQTAKTPLTKAIECGRVGIAKYLLGNGADPQVIINEPKNSYLMKCVTKHNFEMVKFLVELGVELDRPGAEGCTPLKKAIELANFQLVKYFIDKDADCKPKIFYLLKYISERNSEMVECFVNSGAKLDSSGDDGFTPLTKSVETDNFQLVKYFVEKGVDVNLKDGNDKTALGIAASRRYFSMCKFLIESKADVELAKSEVIVFSRCNEDFDIFLRTHKIYISSSVDNSGHEESDLGNVKRIKMNDFEESSPVDK